MSPLVRVLLPFALLVAAAGTASATDPPSPPGGPTLQGENLVAPFTGLTVTSNCDESGTSTVTYDAAGAATGPFPGTFEAHGEITIGLQTIVARPPAVGSEGTFMGPILTLTETFTIVSADTTITGTKTLTQPLAALGERERATCQDVTLFAGITGTGRIVEVEAATTYNATIQAPSGTFTDTGRATPVLTLVEITGECAGGVQCESRSGNFDQLFTLSDQAPQPPTCEEDDEHKRKGCEDDDD
jgi:hypothetical protein